ncbi:MBL fold metallo-hydrolase [Veronia nyctiphanis]|uniref:MBL fold metallo-hydrolase n=1 Tax=Veronia nyctiphanis TaxID=1278244 RepID=A0A4Q0YSC8_9GAMM|nr:MBL fold metallo-hydrolase [Veronia nyctiphanis]RXJ74130.1 MBL fold metallo-hydrolase [Veronia nyctiphanis]
MNVQHFFHRATGTLTYLVSDRGEAVVIDPVLDYETGQVAADSLQIVIEAIKRQGLKLKYILETHIHADHLSGAQALKAEMGGKVAISEKVIDVYETWIAKVNGNHLARFDILLKGGDTLPVGEEVITVLATPGHTPADLTYHIANSVFVGDTLFSPKRGTARADFPGGSAEDLYRSITSLYELPEDTRVYLCHDYPEQEDEPELCSTLATQKSDNVMINAHVSEAEYIKSRSNRDNQLAAPKLLDVAIPFNLTYVLPR